MMSNITPNHLLSINDIIGLILTDEVEYTPGYITEQEIRDICYREDYTRVYVVKADDFYMSRADFKRTRICFFFDPETKIINSYNSG